VVEPVATITLKSEVSDEVDDLVAWPANDESAAHEQWRYGRVATWFVCRRIFHRHHL